MSEWVSAIEKLGKALAAKEHEVSWDKDFQVDGVPVPVRPLHGEHGVYIGNFRLFETIRLERKQHPFTSISDVEQAVAHIEEWLSLYAESKPLLEAGKTEELSAEERAAAFKTVQTTVKRLYKNLRSTLEERGLKVEFEHTLLVEGVRIPLRVVDTTAYGIWPAAVRGKIEIYFDRLRSLPSKSFRQTKAHKKTDGFDIPKIATHIERWVSTWNQTEGPARAARKRREQWKEAARGLRHKYPSAASRARLFTGCSEGVELHLVLDGKEAEAVLVLLETMAKKQATAKSAAS